MYDVGAIVCSQLSLRCSLCLAFAFGYVPPVAGMPRAFDAEGRKKGLAAKRASLVKEAHDIRLATIALRARQGRWLKRRATFRKDRRQLIYDTVRI